MRIDNKKIFIVLTGLMITLFCFMGVSGGAEKQTKKEVKMINEGNIVKVNYTLTVEGDVVDSSKEGEPFEFHIGKNQVIPGFEKNLIGMKEGEKKSFKIGPEEGYGQENPKAIQKVSKDRLPSDPAPEVGMTLYANTPEGQTINGRIIEVKGDTVVVDFNHPLAGKTLNFDVEVVEIN